MLSSENRAQFQGWLSRQVPERLEGNSEMLTDYITALCENAKSGNDLRQELSAELGSMTKPGMDVRDFVGDIMHHVDGGAAVGRGARGRSRSPPPAGDRRPAGGYGSGGAQGGAPRPFGDPFAAAGHPSTQSSQHSAPHSSSSQEGGRPGGYGGQDSRGRQGGYGGGRDGGSSQGGRYAQGQHGGGGGGGSRSLRVGELPPQLMDLARLSGHFGRYGIVTNIMLQASKRAAYVQMDSQEAAQRALESREYVCGHSAVRLSWAKHDPNAPRDAPQGAQPDAQGLASAAAAQVPAHGGAPVIADAPVSAGGAGELSAAAVISGDGVGAPVQPPTMDKNTARVLSLVQRKGEELNIIAGMLQSYKDALARLKAEGADMSPGDKQALLVQLKATGAEIKRKQAASASALETAKRAAESAAAAAAMDPAEKRAAALAARGGRGRGRGGMRGGGAGRPGRMTAGDAADSVEVSDVSDVVAAAAAALAGTGMLKSEAEGGHDGVDGEYDAADDEEGGDEEEYEEEGYDDEAEGGADGVVVGDE